MVTEKKVFFIIMIIMAVLDLLFNCTFTYIRCAPLSLTVAIVHAFVFSFSLASDLCALGLTLERYMALCWPRTMQNLSARTARISRITGAIVVSTVSLVRAQYTVEDLEVLQPFSPTFKQWWEPIYVALSVFGDMVLPVLLTVSMVFFSVGIIVVVVRRQRIRAKVSAAAPSRQSIAVPAQVAVGIRPHSPRFLTPRKLSHMDQGAQAFEDDPECGNSRQNLKKPDDSSSVVSLVLILDFFFILNQLGYCFYAASEVYKGVCNDCQESKELYVLATFVSDVLECMSRSLHFYFYLKFSHLLRGEFLAVVSRVKSRFLG